jgi:2,4-dienoyl-CoA reductase-like NADH-dependent reductase (Old Yellow Enzyme family)
MSSESPSSENHVGFLWKPITVRGLTLKNRIVISPMAMYSAHDGVMDDFHLVHLGRFALGGASLVFTEAIAINQDGRITHGCAGLWNDRQVTAMRRITDFLHRFGAAAGIQFCHSGHKGSAQRPWHGGGALGAADVEARREAPWRTVSVTDVPFDATWPSPAMLNAGDLNAVITDFVEAAKKAEKAGFDVIELHCAHGYLLHSFLSPLTNTRTDAFGGDLQGRMRFPLRVIEAVRAVWPRDKPLFVRVSSVDGVDVGWSAEDTVAFAKALQALDVDAVDCSSGGMKLSRQQQLVSRTPGFQVPYAARVRREAGIKSIAVGLIRDADHAEDILQAGDADLIAIGREALFDPNWAAHAALRSSGEAGWAQWPEQFGWWLQRRARQQGDKYGRPAAAPAVDQARTS